ncbi:hypothetical protein WG78_13970 [Amantichitinum ursilacus]|uniref:Uncharacterized protein n=1 Tax=Amantichitinum ursilacus TaxID=857265 RepID=A0A0N0GN13_9NEIS|nr:hypothetical protein WG78_13970 [Amantichitinum ursilacus]
MRYSALMRSPQERVHSNVRPFFYFWQEEQRGPSSFVSQ